MLFFKWASSILPKHLKNLIIITLNTKIFTAIAQLTHAAMAAKSNNQFRALILNEISVILMRSGNIRHSHRLAKWAHGYRGRRAEIYHYQSVASRNDRNSICDNIFPERLLFLKPVKRVGYKSNQVDINSMTHRVSLPPTSLCKLIQVDVIGGSEIIFLKSGEILYDEIALGDVNRYGGKIPAIVPRQFFSPHLPAATKDLVLCIFYTKNSFPTIPCAISLLKDHSQNYYHWLLECLPRAILANSSSKYKEYPLLIDDGLPSQIIDSLRLIAPTRAQIVVPHGQRVQVDELIFPSVLSFTHDLYKTEARIEDFIIAPEVVPLLRTTFFPHASILKEHDIQPLIYIARSGGSHRSIINEAEILKLAEEIGFKIVYPGKLTFSQQISLFYNAKVIIGPTGAGMANIVFSKASCKIFILAAATNNANYQIFSQISNSIGNSITYILGKPRNPSDIQSHYEINANDLKMALNDIV